MAKIKGNNPPLADWEYLDAAGDDHYFGEFYRQILKEAYPSPGDPDTDITGQSPRGARPSQQGEGTPEQEDVRAAFSACAALWDTLPEECPEPPTVPPTTSKASVWQAKQDFGVVCSYYDLFMRCCIGYALGNDGAMPDGDCFPCGSGCTCEEIAIGYTTQGMQVNEQQTLTVIGAVEGCTYAWAITSGGGSLSAPSGTSVIYTAPSTNPNCDLNATVVLSVDGDPCDSVEIAINAVVDGNYAYYAVTVSPWKKTQYCGYRWNAFRCNGVVRSYGENSSYCCSPGDACPYTEENWPDVCFPVCPPVGALVTDIRTEAMIAAGCCSDSLL